jgi:hypothetical protein
LKVAFGIGLELKLRLMVKTPKVVRPVGLSTTHFGAIHRRNIRSALSGNNRNNQSPPRAEARSANAGEIVMKYCTVLVTICIGLLISATARAQLNGIYSGHGHSTSAATGVSISGSTDDLFEFQFTHGQLTWFGVIANVVVNPPGGNGTFLGYCDYITNTSECPGPYQYNLLFQYFSSGTTCSGTSGIPMQSYGCAGAGPSTIGNININQIVVADQNNYGEFDFIINGVSTVPAYEGIPQSINGINFAGHATRQ